MTRAAAIWAAVAAAAAASMRARASVAALLIAGCAAPPPPALREARPQLPPEEAARHRVEDYLAQGPGPFVPLSRAEIDALPADLVVAADGTGTHRRIQDAVDDVPAAGAGARRHVIELHRGTYREPLCIRAKAPLLLRGVAADAGAVRIVEGRWNGQPKAAGQPAHPCVPALEATTHGTGGSTSVALFSDDVVLAHLSVANDATDEGRRAPGGTQAVALTTAGDRIQLENVRLSSHQDTFYARRPAPAAPARVFVRASRIAGDVDFVFGNATLVIAASTLHSRGDRADRADREGRQGREAAAGGIVLAPSTPPGVRHGFLVIDCRFTADAGLAPGSVALGRAWDQGVPRGRWQPAVSPNGQALVRQCRLGPHIGPWVDSTAGRPVGATGAFAHRLAELDNHEEAAP